MTPFRDQAPANLCGVGEEGEQVERPGWRQRVRHHGSRAHRRLHANPVTGALTKVVITVVGFAVILLGIIMSGPGIPGPGIVVILLGLALLATEWEWAERLLQWGREKVRSAADHARAMDPVERRRRLLLTALGVLVVATAATGYVLLYDWPRWSVSGWDWMQGRASFVPDLPGM